MSYTLTFPRAENPLVSVLLPTRGRPKWLSQSIQSLSRQAVQPDKVEFLFRADADDLETIEICRFYCEKLPNARVLIDKRGLGYREMHLWINTLCKLARGDWLLVWNDDALMATPKWDEILSQVQVQSCHNNPDVYMLVIPVNRRPLYCTEFMFVRRKVAEVLGHYSLSPHNDNWITRVLSKANSWGYLHSLAIDHLSDSINDKTREESVAAYDNGALAKTTLEAPEAQRAIQYDANKLLAYLGR